MILRACDITVDDIETIVEGMTLFLREKFLGTWHSATETPCRSHEIHMADTAVRQQRARRNLHFGNNSKGQVFTWYNKIC